MKRFFQRIRDKAKDVTLPSVTIVALGDSVTQGVMEHRVLDGEGVYHNILKRELEAVYPSTSFSVINAGVSGGSAPQAVERLERDVLRHDPDLVLVAFGLNDSLGKLEKLPVFENALRTIVAEIREKTQAGIILITPPFMARRGSFRVHADHEAFTDVIVGAQVDGSLALYAEAIRKVAVGEAVGLVDVHREWERLSEDGMDTDVWLINGLNHPDRRGHKLAATLILTELLSSRE